jgi:hypothetical protein
MSKPKVDHATPQITETSQSAEQLFEDGTKIVANITASTALTNAPDVQTALKALGAANAALGTNNASKAAGRLQLDTALTAEGPLVRRWGIRKRALVSAIEVAGDGSADLVAAFNVAVEKREPRPDAVVPVNLRPMKTAKSGCASVRWDTTAGATGYMLQHATNPADPTTYSPQIHVSAAKYRLPGTPGATVYFRVLALDASLPLGQTAFCAWVAAIVAA